LSDEPSLRDVVASDIPIFYEQQADPEAAAMAAFPPRDEADHFAHLKKILGDPTVFMRTIIFGGEVAGNLVSWATDDGQEIGYWIGRPYWGKGIASAVLPTFVKLVEQRPLHAYVAEHNAASIRVLEKAGFVHSGRTEQHLVYTLR